MEASIAIFLPKKDFISFDRIALGAFSATNLFNPLIPILLLLYSVYTVGSFLKKRFQSIYFQPMRNVACRIWAKIIDALVRVLFHFNLFFYFFCPLQYPYPPPSIYSTYLLYFLFQIYSLLHTNIPRLLLSLIKSIDPQLWTLLKSNHPPSVSQSPRRKFLFCFFMLFFGTSFLPAFENAHI